MKLTEKFLMPLNTLLPRHTDLIFCYQRQYLIFYQVGTQLMGLCNSAIFHLLFFILQIFTLNLTSPDLFDTII